MRLILNRIAEFQFVKKMFDECNRHKEKYGFRNKLEHTERVYLLANRLLKYEEADKGVVLTATIFHDVGYLYSHKEHTKYSAEICKQYLQDNNYNTDFIKKVVDIIANHGNKELLFNPNTSMEQILLIEADCLDESGALSILRDTLSEGSSSEKSYKKTYERLCERSIMKNPDSFNCVTETAKNIWLEKQELYMGFIDNLKKDLIGFDSLLLEDSKL